jgi:hypothetical protein
VIVKRQLSKDEEPAEDEEASSVYRKIFASYSHKDSEIVEKIEAAYEAFGDEYMRDVKILRSGEEWNPALLKLIKQADVFQLFWSEAAKKSKYVEKEWREALKQKKKNFIRVVCLEEPTPQPPPELKNIHFTKLTEMYDQQEKEERKKKARPKKPKAQEEATKSHDVGADEHDDVYLGTEAPSSVSRGEEFVARFAAYTASNRDEVFRVFKAEAPSGRTHSDLAACRWRFGTKVTVRLHASHAEITNAEQSFQWNGDYHILKFDAKVLNKVETKNVILRFDVAVEGFAIIRLRPEIRVRQKETNRRRMRRGFIEERRIPRSAFASYAKEDQEDVLGRVRSLEISTEIDVFKACLSICPAERWKSVLENEIRERDIFLLFWSRRAKESQCVEWEWRKALDEKTLDGIQPHPLEPVEVAPPPKELADLQFGSTYESYVSQL